mgnify:CR=1 FL=1
MKEKLKNILLILIGIGVLAYLSVTAVIDLTDSENIHTVTLTEAYSVLDIEHSINGIIPIGTDHYYLGYNSNTSEAYLIKVSKSWYDKNFDADGTALSSDGITVKGIAKAVSDFDTKQELDSRLSQLDLVYPYGMLNCLDLDYVLRSVLKLIDCVLLIAVVISGIYVLSTGKNSKPVLFKVWLIGMIISLILLLTVIR